MPIDTWTDERIATLTRMWADGYSCTRIGVALKCSRSSVIGKVTRLRLPAPEQKLPVIADRTYITQLPEISAVKRRERERRYQKKRRERQRASLDTKRDVRKQFLARGATTTSAEYRKHLPPLPEMSKSALRAMLAQAAQNTAAL